MVKKGGMHGFTEHIVAAEGERDIAYASADHTARKRFLDGSGGFDKGFCIVVVLFYAGGHG